MTRVVIAGLIGQEIASAADMRLPFVAGHVAPGVFTVTDIAEVTGTGPDELLGQAARACPAGAIVLLDADTGEEVDP